MIALAGAVGTGLFLGSGRAIAAAGPLGAWLGYTLVGCLVAPVVWVMGEMGALVPLSGGVVRYAELFVDPALSFANGWNLVYSYLVSIPAEIVAAAVLVEFWVTVNNAIWITLFGVLMLITAFSMVRVYGEVEFFFCTLKILLVIGINVMALVITCGGGPSGKSIGFRYWHSPGPFVQYLGINGSLGRFLGFWTTFNNAIYAYSGVEAVTIPAAETRNPRKVIPQATKRIFIRIAMFYVMTIFMVGLVVPSNDPSLLHSTGTAAQSPFVISAKNAGIKAVPSIINAVVITSAFSSGNANLLGGARILYSMARNGRAPWIFTRLNRFQVPYVAEAFYGLFMCLGYMTLSDSASTVFEWLQDIVSASTLVNWIVICITYLRFYYGCKKQGIDRKKDLPWAAPLQPYSTWLALCMFCLLYLTAGYKTFMHGRWSSETFVSSYLNLPIVITLYFIYKYVCKTKVIPLRDIPIRDYFVLESDEGDLEDVEKQHSQSWKGKLNVLWS
ncbi:proline-specific permease [Polychaeton citri CBS 116435]|uniref:Proline-specific permease n=1 Tax=Polychaeton citri CBS 116435 TaxID=1314669 RepID=A0A9P4UJX9_9PEZI|nr:proline-specific permease [Polychaeton citri CBS 116435]